MNSHIGGRFGWSGLLILPRLAPTRFPDRLSKYLHNRILLSVKPVSKIRRHKRREAAKVLALTASRGVSSKWLVNSLDVAQRKRFHAHENFIKFQVTENH